MDPIESTVDIEAYDRLENVLHSPAAYNGYDRSASCEEEEESFQDDFTKTKDSLLEKQRSRNTSSAPNVGIVYDLAEQKGDHSQQVNGDSAALVKETEVGDAENVVQLQTDIFSMFFLSPILSSSSLYTIVIFAVQITILILVLVNKLSDINDGDGNQFKIPVSSDMAVDLSQFFALLISVFASADVVDSLESVLIKYDGTILRDFPAASKTKWILSNVGRFVEGVLGIAVAWVFIIQSTDVLGLFLDFTAVQFVSELDNVGYYIANKGFIIGGNVQSLTESMLNVRMSQAEKLDDNGDILRKKLRVRRLFKHLVFRGTIFILISTWTYVKILQFGGAYYKFRCQRFQINLPTEDYAFFQKCNEDKDDEKWEDCPDSWKVRRNSNIHYAQFSGVYKMRTNEDGSAELMDKYSRQPVYVQVSPTGEFYAEDSETPPGIFRYCKQENAWVFTIDKISKGANADDCSWLLKSPETDAPTLDDLPEADWEVWTGAIEQSTVDITCLDCTDTKSMRAEYQIKDSGCNFHGECGENEKRGICDCLPGFSGTRCSRCSGCVLLDILNGTERIGTFKRLDRSIDEPVEVYDRTVRYNVTKESTGNWVPARPFHAFFYWNDRYVLWNLEDAMNVTLGEDIGDNIENLVAYFDSFHAAWEISQPWYVAEINRDRWEKAEPKWKPFDDYRENPEYTVGSYEKFKYECISEEFSVCRFTFGMLGEAALQVMAFHRS